MRQSKASRHSRGACQCAGCAHANRRVERAYYRTCSGVQINVLDIGKVFTAGRAALDAGADETGLEAAIVAFVNTIRR